MLEAALEKTFAVGVAGGEMAHIIFRRSGRIPEKPASQTQFSRQQRGATMANHFFRGWMGHGGYILYSNVHKTNFGKGFVCLFYGPDLWNMEALSNIVIKFSFNFI